MLTKKEKPIVDSELEGLCQVVAHRWLECQADAALSSASSHMPMQSDFEKKLVEFCKKVKEMVTRSMID